MEHIFRDHMADLYWLAFILTGERGRSAYAFTQALDGESKPETFQGSGLSWARRLVIAAALESNRTALLESIQQNYAVSENDFTKFSHRAGFDMAGFTKRELESALLQIDLFPRCALILSVLEGLPLDEAAALLGAGVDAVKAARVRGLIEMTWRLGDGAPLAGAALAASSGMVAAFV